MTEKERYEILFEDMNSKFDLIMEGHQITQRQAEEYKKDTDKKIEELSSLLITSNKSLRKEIQENRKEIQENTKEIQGVKVRVDSIETKLDEHMRQPAHV